MLWGGGGGANQGMQIVLSLNIASTFGYQLLHVAVCVGGIKEPAFQPTTIGGSSKYPSNTVVFITSLK